METATKTLNYSAIAGEISEWLKRYALNAGQKGFTLGVSGGIDSAVTACIAKEALGKDNLLLLSMPSRFSSLEGIEDAEFLADNLKVKIQDLPIDGLFQSFLDYYRLNVGQLLVETDYFQHGLIVVRE